MNRKTSIIVSITGIVIIILALLGLTYGYYVSKITGNESTKSIEVITGDSSVKFTDLSEDNINEIIEPGYTTTKSFTVENTGNIGATYSIFFVDVYNDFVRTEDVVYTLYRIDNDSTFPTNYEGCIENPTDEKSCKIVVNNAEFPTSVALIKANETITTPEDVFRYDLVITYINHPTINQNVDQGHTFKGSINIRASMDDLDNPFSEGTLAYNILNNGADITTFTTTGNFIGDSMCGMDEATCVANVAAGCPGTCYEPGSEVTTSETKNTKTIKTTVDVSNVANGNSWNDELQDYTNDGLFSTEDDYGISYYFRGPVSKNYVNFAGMCWRIVRIDGKGNTKLILEDQDEVCSTSMNGNWDIEASDGTNITMDGSEPYRTGNFGYDDSRMLYLNPVDNSNIAMVNAFKYFQTNTLTNKITSTYTRKSISDFLVSGNWCLNTKAYSDTKGTTLLEKPDYSSTFYYDSYVRLNEKTEPTLKCPVDTLYKFDDNSDDVISENETDMYVGTLTADEIVYAGGKANENNTNYFLINNWQASNSGYFWTLSPYISFSNSDVVFIMNNYGNLSNESVNNYSSFRPSIILKSTAVITEGEGTIRKPYVIG